MKKTFVWLLFPLLLLLSFSAIAEKTADPPAWQAYNGKRIGVLTGPLMEDIAHTYFPDSEYMLFNSYPDCIAALLSGRIDAYLGDEPGLKSVHEEQPQIDYFHERITSQYYSFAFRKNDEKSTALCEELNRFLAACHADGTIRELEEIWFGEEEDRKVVDMSGLTGENGAVRVVTTSTDMPFSYIKDGLHVGYDIDLVVRFCRWAGYTLELGDVDFGARIPAVQSGKFDFSTDMNVTAERKEQVLFSDPTSSGGVVLAYLASGSKSAPQASRGSGNFTLDDLDGKRIGVMTGTISGRLAETRFPHAAVSYFNTQADSLTALRSGKIDAWVTDEPILRYMRIENPALELLDGYLAESNLAAVFPKTDAGRALCDQFNDFLNQLWTSGEMSAIDAVWFGTDDSLRTVLDYEDLPAVNGTLHMAADLTQPPFTYMKNNRAVGYDVDVAARFCQEYGYGLIIESMTFDGVLAAVQSGKSDFAISCITITEERAETMLFSTPDYYGGIAAAVLSAGAEAPVSGVSASSEQSRAADTFWDGILSSFNKTFLRENRWQLFLEGIGSTMLITLLSILLGTLLGFAVFLLCRNGNAAANGITRFFTWLIQGTPMVVLLMILYYIIFGSLAISGLLVAVIGFSLTFGAAVFGLLKMGVGTVDRGQYEAAYALGHSNSHTFFRIILPQAIPHVLPAYQSEIVGLIKATAIVGYIAVQDLTKMGDIVRSRTYEAFFPLIAITVIYFAVEWLFGFAVSRIRISIDPRRRRHDRILKGIDTAGGTASPHAADAAATPPAPEGLRETPIIRIEHLRKEYPNVIPLKDVSVEIREGDVISIIGPSGTGKSTLLRCINQMEKPTSGRVWIDSKEITDSKNDINQVRQKMGMVFQSFNLFGHLTVIENIMLSPVDLLGKSRQEAYDNGMQLLRTVGLAEKAFNYPDELSGGQKQRIAIARTLAMDPDIILLDEPTSALDPTMVGEVQAVIRDLAKTGKTLMIVTHEMNFARAISNRVFFMDEGGIYEDGTPDQVFDHPLRENTRRFIRRLKVLELNIESRDYDFPGMVGQIETYCTKNQIPYKTAARLCLVFEEALQLLVPLLSSPRLMAVCEYSEATECAVWTISYNGPHLDVTCSEEDLPMAVLKGMTSALEYAWEEGEDLPNRLCLEITST